MKTKMFLGLFLAAAVFLSSAGADARLLPDGDDAFAHTGERTGVGRKADVLLLYGPT